jgi:hypothetical protein
MGYIFGEESRTRLKNFALRLASYFLLLAATGLFGSWYKTWLEFRPLEKIYFRPFIIASLKSNWPTQTQGDYMLLGYDIKGGHFALNDDAVCVLRDAEGKAVKNKDGYVFRARDGVKPPPFGWLQRRLQDRQVKQLFSEAIYQNSASDLFTGVIVLAVIFVGALSVLGIIVDQLVYSRYWRSQRAAHVRDNRLTQPQREQRQALAVRREEPTYLLPMKRDEVSWDVFPLSENLREYGLSLVRLEASKAWGVIAITVGPLALAVVIVGVVLWLLFHLPLLAVGLIAYPLAIIVRLPMCVDQWRILRRRRQELRLLYSILPMVAAYRRARQINNADRALIYMARESILSMVERLRDEAHEWRRKGREKKGAALATLIYDLEDAQKLLGESFATEEKQIRPAPPPPQLVIEPAPISQTKSWRKTGLERPNKKTIYEQNQTDDEPS